MSRAFTLGQDLSYDRRFTVHCSRFCGACLQLQRCSSQPHANTAGLARRSQGCVAMKRQAQDLPLMTSRTFSTLQSQPPKPLASSTWVLKYLMTAVMFSVNSPKTGSPCIATRVSADRYGNAYIVLPQQSQPPKPLTRSTWVLKYLMTAVMISVNSPKTGPPCIATQLSADRCGDAYIVLPQQSQRPQRRACLI